MVYWNRRILRFEGLENVERALSKGKGIIFCTAHFGNWELLGAYYAQKGYPVNVVARNLRDQRYEELISGYRNLAGMKVLHKGNQTREMLRCLHRGEGLAILFDQDTKGGGQFVDFFGYPAYTLEGPVILAQKTGAVLLPGFISRVDKKSHRITIKPHIEASKESDTVEVLTKLNKCLEEMVRKYPTDWVWIHKRWRRKPE